MIRWSIFALAILSCGCSRSSDSFAVRVIGSDAQSASVSVCGKTAPLTRGNDGTFTGIRTIDCEGEGEVRVTLQDGTVVHCPVGYVTGIHQEWSFMVNGRTCSPLDREVG